MQLLAMQDNLEMNETKLLHGDGTAKNIGWFATMRLIEEADALLASGALDAAQRAATQARLATNRASAERFRTRFLKHVVSKVDSFEQIWLKQMTKLWDEYASQNSGNSIALALVDIGRRKIQDAELTRAQNLQIIQQHQLPPGAGVKQ